MPRPVCKGYLIPQGDTLPAALSLFDEGSDIPGIHMEYRTPLPRYLDEIRVLFFIQSVLEKPSWRSKMEDDTIWSKWKEEALTQEPLFREEMFDYTKEELRWLAKSRDIETGIEPTGVDLVWRSDSLLPEDLRKRFLKLINRFESNIPVEQRDWHPKSDEKVLNLIHPSMYCLVYNESVNYNGETTSSPRPPDGRPYPLAEQFDDTEFYNQALDTWYRTHEDSFWSPRFQWLPSEFLIDKAGKVKIASYINSLPPVGEVNRGLYLALAEIFERAVPLLNIVLTDLTNCYRRKRFGYGTRGHGYNDRDDELKYRDDDEDNIEQEDEEWDDDTHLYPKLCVIPAFNEQRFTKFPLDKEREIGMRRRFIELRGHQVQVIVKIGSIQLTPEKPTFEGGNWHVEGMANESIVATVIYYYDSENIMGDELKFRQAVYFDSSNGPTIDQDDTPGARKFFGMGRDDPLVQDAGSVKTPQGRVLCFPNLYQHRVPEFTLADKTKPGYRKILVFFLVDPFIEGGIVSTAEIPPQEIEDPRWRDADLEEMMRERLPVELVEMIDSYLYGGENGEPKRMMTKEKALKNRIELMAERSYNGNMVTKQLFERPFDLCEH